MVSILSELVGVSDGDVISVVGSGGKTSFVYCLSKELESKRVLVSTTTKMFVPTVGDFSYIELDKDSVNKVIDDDKKGTFFIADKDKNNDNKVQSLPLDYLNELIKKFNITILECDGSKRKLIKGWESFEPVIIPITTKTVGIINISIIGESISEKNVHRLEKFNKLTLGIDKSILTLEHYVKVITHGNGLFGKAKGERILFINGVDNEQLEIMAIKLISMIRGSEFIVDNIVYGSLKLGYVSKEC